METLFHKFDSHSAIEHYKSKLILELTNLTEPELKGTSIAGWIEFFRQKFSLQTPIILHDQIYFEMEDVKVDASKFYNRYARDPYNNDPVMVDGNTFTLTIPFEGNKDLFFCSGNRIYHRSIKAKIVGDNLILKYDYISEDSEKINSDSKNDIKYIEELLECMRSAFENYNSSIAGIVQQYLNERIEKFKKDEELKSKLAFPLKQRNMSNPTYVSPTVQKVIKVEKPKAIIEHITPEPIISDNDYNDILKICHNMTLVMEKSPHAFKKMGEEDIRQHFLVQLNGQYEGGATGETFNFEGKTDILVKDNGRNIFIAECKFWKGSKTINETINQLLNYTTWRDSKTAIFLFNRNKNFSEVLNQIPGLVQSHPNFISKIKSEIDQETEFRFMFKQKDDASKRITLTLLAFDIPT